MLVGTPGAHAGDDTLGAVRTTFVCLMIGAVAASAAAGCARKSCLRGDCEAVRACDELRFACEPGALYVGRLADAPAALRLDRGEGAAGDLLLSNGIVTVVIDALDEPHGLAPTGGNVLDFGPAGGTDDLNLVYQIAGILPDDAFAFDRLEVVDRRPDYVAVIARGRLDGRPEVAVLTRYELRPCDPGLRVRSELFNDSPDVHAWVIADVPHWGKRRSLPFSPRPGQGYLYPELDLLRLDDLYDRYDYGAAAATGVDSPGYGVAACNQTRLEGINDLELSAFGTDRQLVRPGQSVTFERFWIAAGAGQGPGPAIEGAIGVRQQLLGDLSPRVYSGRVVAGGLGFGGHARRASIVVAGRDGGVETPLTAVVPDEDGRFRIAVPARAELVYELWSFGRPVARGTLPREGGALDDLEVPLPATLLVQVADPGGDGLHAQVVLVPADDATFAEVRGTFHGRYDECAPWLGPPHGASPACNRFLVDPAGGEAEVPAGRYDVYATAGPDHTLARHPAVELVAGEVTALDFELTRLDVVPAGWLSADLHVHGRASFDSAIPDADRVRSFVAAGIDVIAATDHDYVTDYSDAVAALGLGDRVVVMGGIETTQLIPWLEVPGDAFPRVIGHFNFWPITPVPSAPRGGAPWDERIAPGELFDRMAPLVGADGVMMINHPWDEPTAGRDLGFLRAIKFDPRRPIPAVADGSRHGLLLDAPAGGHRNVDWDVMEVQNGAGLKELVKTRPLWFSLISQGYPVPGVASSDSHGLTDAQLGWARTLVETGGDLAGFTPGAFNRAIREGRLSGGSGIFVDVRIVDGAGAPVRGLGLTPWVPAAGEEVEIEVRAAPWIPVSEVRVVTSRAVRVIAAGAEVAQPADPFGVAGVLRFRGRFPVEALVPGAADDWLVIEAGLPLPPYADLDDDGVPDTGDNNGDGRVDAADVADGEDAGPLRDPPDPPRDAHADPRYWMTRVVPRAFPIAFAGPILIDRAGDGWAAPGVAP
jgi:hypothetical protein